MDGRSVLVGLWVFLPAYVANMSPVFTARIFPWWGAPIDGGRLHSDGRRVLGDGKTWRGLAGGGLFGGATAVVLAHTAAGPFRHADFGLALGSHPAAVFAFGFLVGFLALTGDAVESYFKRRRGKERGAPWIPFDQLDFVAFGLLGFALGTPLLAAGWAWDVLWSDWLALATIVLGTIGLHLLVNRVGYWIGLKEVPW